MKKLLIVSLSISITGILFLLILANFSTLKEVSSYKELKLNNYVKTMGKITSIQTYGDFSIIRLNNSITITCNCRFQVNSTIQVSGKVVEYQNKLQISADRIELTKQS